METIDIREAVPQDAAQLLAYLRAVGAESDNLSFGGEGLSMTQAQEAEYLRQTHFAKTSVQLLAVRDGEIIGDGSLQGFSRRMQHRAELGLAVRKAYWNCGVGSSLMRALLAFAKANGVELLQLEVRSDHSAAIHLYEKFGFRRIGTLPAYFKIDGSYIDFDLMALDLRTN